MANTSSPRSGPRADRLLTYADVAEWIGVPERSVRKWTYAGTGPRIIKIGRHCRIKESDLLAWLDTRYAS